MKIINENEIKKLIKLDINYNFGKDDINICDKDLEKFFKYYKFMIDNFEILIKNKDRTITMYSVYYWHNKYKKRYFDIMGYDAGLEQESFKLLENIENEMESGVDWDIIKEIEMENEDN